MVKVQLEDRQLFGVTVRTNNQNECGSAGKIGALWQSVFGEIMQKPREKEALFGVYSSYESDCQGDYDYSVAIEESVGLAGETSMMIPAGEYLRFEKSGECPTACMELWQEIWEYFERSDSPRRKYAVDFEEYVSKTDVAIYIGIL